MPAQPVITEAQVRALATPESFARGQEYYEGGTVSHLTRRGDELHAEVEGSAYRPYEVSITLDAGGVAAVDCTCPYDWGGICKHSVATLLAYIHAPDAVEERPPLETVLTNLSAEQLRTILTALVAQQPGLADAVESQVLLVQHAPTPAAPAGVAAGAPSPAAAAVAAPAAPRPRQTPLDPTPFARQVRAAFGGRDRRASWESYGHALDAVDAVGNVADQAVPYIEAGDGRNALVILEAVTAEYMDAWTDMDDSDGEYGAFFDDLGALWAEALLSADLTSAERQTWAKRLDAWRKELDDYGVGDSFAAAAEAARQGWDYPPLVRVLQGEVTEQGAWEGAAPDYADLLTQVRLHILERQGRTQEYLHLAEAEGQMQLYVTMLAKLGRTAEAVDAALQDLTTPDETLTAAQALRAQGALEEALRVAEHGLTLPGSHASLARWLRDAATGAGQPERALAAAEVALREMPSLAEYQAVEALAGPRWPALRAEFLAALRKGASYYPQAQVDIFLHEGLIDDAIASVSATTAPALLDRVMAAAITGRPAWVISLGTRMARTIIEAGQAKHYSQAIHWLDQARAAAAASDQLPAWRTAVQALLAAHRRKYSLVPQLEALLKRK